MYPFGRVRSYAIRRLNPFLGVLQILETRDGRAVTVNGVVWQLELGAVTASSEWGSLNRNNSKSVYYRYGMWSQAEGVVSYPLPPQFDSESMRLQAEVLIAEIRVASGKLPFRLQDNRELWLFDLHNEQPLALLATTAPWQTPPRSRPRVWKAALDRGSPGQQRFPAAEAVEALIRQRAGFNLQRRWIARQNDGRGIVENSLTEIDANIFPPFLLTLEWPEDGQRRLVRDYVAWTAPALLTLQQLSAGDRDHLENSLYIQAQSVEHHWRLYPLVLDETLLKATRVQCRLQGSVG